MKRHNISLSLEERLKLIAITSKGRHDSRMVVNALILLACDKGEYQDESATNETISRVLRVSMPKISRIKKRFIDEGLLIAINGKPSTRIYARKADEKVEAQLLVLQNLKVPDGYKRWTVKLLADKILEMSDVGNISYDTVRRVLKRMQQRQSSLVDNQPL